VFIYRSVVSELHFLISITKFLNCFPCACKWRTAHLNKYLTLAHKYQTFTNQLISQDFCLLVHSIWGLSSAILKVGRANKLPSSTVKAFNHISVFYPLMYFR